MNDLQAEMTGQIRAYRIHYIDKEGIKKYEVALKKVLLPEILRVKREGGVIISVGIYDMRSGETTFAVEEA